MALSIAAPPVNLFKRTFSKAEWEQIEEYLINALNSIAVPEHVTPEDIQQLNAALDKLSASVMWLYAVTKRAYEGIQMDRKNAEKQVYMLVRDAVDDQGKPTGKKRTEAEIAAATTEYLNSTPINGYPQPIYVMEKAAMERYVFMQAIVDTMKQKSEKMITDLGAIKLEVQITPDGTIDSDEPVVRRAAARNMPPVRS